MTISIDTHPKGKNKERASQPGDSGASSGILLNLDMVLTSQYTVAYTVPVQVGSSQQNLSLQVDTGSSDLWIASKACSSAECSATSGNLYDPSSSQSTGAALTMQYLAGSINGPIVWDQLQIGGYIIPNQALVAATTVNDEPLSYNFDGILGLAFPLNSLIQQTVPAGVNNASNGATFPSNLFSLTPASDAPSQPFFSLSLARPGSDQIPSLLGIGRHPPEIVPDASQIRYSSLVSDSVGLLFWKTTIHAITVYANGHAYPVALQSLSGASEPTALLDSGVPLIVATPALANGIYGALGLSPASDGNYYVPCTIPLNMTITLDGQNEFPLHPLDLTAEPTGQSSSQYCMGLIQTDPSHITANSDIGDMILGVPFMRNVYTVMAYNQPNATGDFNHSLPFGTSPTLGFLGLTNATQAMEEFHQVRVLNQPLGSNSSQQSLTSPEDEPRLSIGIKVLIGLVGFFMLCLMLFGLRFLFSRSRWQRLSRGERELDIPDQELEFSRHDLRTRVDHRTSLYDFLPPLPDRHAVSRYTIDSARTCVENDDPGVRRSKLADSLTDALMRAREPWDDACNWHDTAIDTEATAHRSSYLPLQATASSYPDTVLGSPGITSALLAAHDRSDLQPSDATELDASPGMAGIGTAPRRHVPGP